jgi:hypothetical protein
MLKPQFLILLFGMLISCRQASVSSKKTLDFGAFTIEVPKSWEQLRVQGIDSYVGSIIINSEDTISFDMGPYSNTLTEREPIVFERSSLKYHKGMDTSQVILVDDIRWEKDMDRYRTQSLVWDTIDGREVKIVYPRKAGKGTTGVYIYNLWQEMHFKHHFNLYGENLKPINQKSFLEAIKTLRFHKSK